MEAKAVNDDRRTEADEQAWPSIGYAGGALALLTAAYALSFIDRQVLTLMVEAIKTDLHKRRPKAKTAVPRNSGFAIGRYAES